MKTMEKKWRKAGSITVITSVPWSPQLHKCPHFLYTDSTHLFSPAQCSQLYINMRLTRNVGQFFIQSINSKDNLRQRGDRRKHCSMNLHLLFLFAFFLCTFVTNGRTSLLSNTTSTNFACVNRESDILQGLLKFAT